MVYKAIAGVSAGVLVWGTYGIAEFCSSAFIPFLYDPSHVLIAWHWWSAAAALAIYAAAGAICGAAAGAFLKGRVALQPVVTAMLLGAFFGQIIHRGVPAPARYAALLILLAGCTLFAARVRWTRSIWSIVIAILLATGPVLWFARDAAPAGEQFPAASTAADSPDVVLIIMDTVRADHLSVQGYGRDTTPHLRELARQSTVYTRAVAASNYSLPSHASILTGLYPRRHGAHAASAGGSPGAPLAPAFDTIAEFLGRHGYQTALVAANSGFLNRGFGLTQGFQTAGTPNLFPNPYHLRRAIHRTFQFTRFAEMYRTHASAAAINELAAKRIAATGSGAPLFLFLNYMDAHLPIVVSEPPFDGQRPLTWQQHAVAMDRVERDGGRLTPVEADAIGAHYDGAIRYLDARIGELIDILRRRGRFDNTLLLITSDHGDTLGEARHTGHASDVCEREVHVPLLVKLPSQQTGRVVDTPVSHVDLLPTILDAALSRTAPAADGLSLARPLDASARAVFSESLWPTSVRLSQRAAYAGVRKLIAVSDGSYQFYNVAEDPHELHDLYPAAPAAARDIQSALESWLAANPPFVPPAGAPGAALMERLKALGYVQ